MEQHPVPQHIASFQFKLFGNLTSKQFVTLAIPLGLAALIFFSPLPTIIRLPASFAIGVFAFIIALIPIGGKSADQWAVAFFKALVSPTQRVWIKEKEIPEFLNIVVSAPPSENIPDEIKRMSKERLLAYLRSLPKESESALDVKEQMALYDIDFAYQPQPPSPQIIRFSESPVSISTQEPLQGEGAVESSPKQGPAQESKQAAKPQVPMPQIKDAGRFPPPIIWPSEAFLTSGALASEVAKDGKPAPRSPASPENRGEPASPPGESNISTYGGNYNFQVFMSPSLFQPQPSPLPQTPHGLPAGPLSEARRQAQIALHARPYILPGVEKRLAASASPPSQTAPLVPAINLASETNFSIDNIIPIRTPDNRIKLLHGIGKTRARKLHFAPPANFDLSKLPIRGEKRFELTSELKRFFQIEDVSPEVVLPTQVNKPQAPKKAKAAGAKPFRQVPQHTLKVPKFTHPTLVPKAKSQARLETSQKQDQPVFVPQFEGTKNKNAISQSQNHIVEAAAIVPLTSTANVVSGLVTDSAGSSISGAVLVIRDERGIPIRALKTNKLGQFLSATPLTSGQYTIETESQDYQFKVVRLTVADKVIPPLHIQTEGEPVSN